MNRLMKRSSSILFQHNFKKYNINDLKRTFITSRTVQAGFSKDFKPGPYPKSEAEKGAAAKKYGMRREDYEPYPDDGMGFGDYPNLGRISVDMKSDWEDWDDPYNKRNFGEPLHVNQEQLLNDKVSLKTPTYSFTFMLSMFLAAGFTFFGLAYLTWDYKLTVPIVSTQI